MTTTTFEPNSDGGIQASDGLNYTHFHLISSIERESMISHMVLQTGLEPNQFATNVFGFPAIPKPIIRKSSRGIIRLAPGAARDEFRETLGHPIFWIEPHLTEARVGETEENWSIRMYYLILLMGYWNPEKGWINFLSSKGFDYNPVDVEGYHMGSLPRISIDLPTSAPDEDAAQSAEAGDRYRFLNESDIVGGLAAVEEHYRSAIARCESALLADLKAFLDRQTSCLDIAYQCLGGRDGALHRSDLDFDDSSGSWITVIEPRLFEIAARYRNELAQPAPDMASILEDAEDLYGRVQSVLVAFGNIAATLSVPVIQKGESASTMHSETISYMGLAISQASSREHGYRIVQMVRECFSGRRFETALDEVNVHVHDQYEIAWKRMRLAVVNHQLHIKDKEPLTTYASLEFKMIHGRLWLSTEEANLLDGEMPADTSPQTDGVSIHLDGLDDGYDRKN
ncbi:hypothetical protein ACFVWF_23750 [Rhodococcus qingshengii]|uniref:hypothetical protein n=1 Tax=Rhodococcus qingshengii TaxID=334542 RepID=UPI0036D7C627